jgi:8-oxo-dGTP diphosphatase
VSVAFVTILPRAVAPKAGSDAAGAEWIEDWRSVTLAFDHAQILEDAAALLKPRRRD